MQAELAESHLTVQALESSDLGGLEADNALAASCNESLRISMEPGRSSVQSVVAMEEEEAMEEEAVTMQKMATTPKPTTTEGLLGSVTMAAGRRWKYLSRTMRFDRR